MLNIIYFRHITAVTVNNQTEINSVFQTFIINTIQNEIGLAS